LVFGSPPFFLVLCGFGGVVKNARTTFLNFGSCSGFGDFVMPDEKDLYPVTSEHALWFGVIISEFARFEMRLHVAAAGILGTDMGTAMILLGDMTLRKKIQTIRHLNTTIGINGQINKDVKSALASTRKLSKLRNQIAHAGWIQGRRPNSIKPLSLLLAGEEPKSLGAHHNEKDYLPEDLKNEAEKVTRASVKFYEVLRKEGLLDQIREKIETTKQSTSSSNG
jgi:hypothetical protein